MVTMAKEEHKQGFWQEHWEDVVALVVLIFVVGLLVWGGIYVFKDRAENKARIEASKFQVEGVIEGVREEHRIFKEGLLGFPRKEDSFYISINGLEYKVNGNLEDYDFLKTGQKVRVSGQEGRIDSVSISK